MTYSITRFSKKIPSWWGDLSAKELRHKAGLAWAAGNNELHILLEEMAARKVERINYKDSRSKVIHQTSYIEPGYNIARAKRRRHGENDD